MARDVKPPQSPIAMPGRRYISGIIYLSIVVLVGLLVLAIRWLVV